MRDEETGSWWQQVTGECILGALKGERLRSVMHDELTFAQWRRERPSGRVLRPDERVAAEGRYERPDWEEQTAKLPVVTPATSDTDAARGGDPGLEPRTLVVGVTVDGASKAYPFETLRRQNPVMDEVGGVPLMLVVNSDGKSVRAFDRRVDGRVLEFFVKPSSDPLRLLGAETGGEWDFTGRAVAGALSGRELRKLPVLNDYWFDWKTYHSKTAVYRL